MNPSAQKLVPLLIVVLLLFTLSTSSLSAQAGGQPPPGGNPPAGAPPGGAPPGDTSATNPVLTSTCGAYMLDGETDSRADGQSYASTDADQSVLCVINGGSLSLSNAAITKSGDSSSSDNSSFYGLNAAVLVGSGSSASISGGTVSTDGVGTNGVFSTGTDSTVTLSDLSIDAHGDGAHGVMATLGGSMTLDNVDINTTGAHSGAIATDRGGGTLTVTGGTVTTSGEGSPDLYSTGTITVSDATMSSSGSEAAVIEGANSITLTNTDLSSSKAGLWGVMIYQSMSGDAEGTEGRFSMTGGSLADSAADSPLFFVTNSTGIITLSGVDISAASGTLVQAGATDRWGTSGSNGGTVILTAEDQSLSGDLIADSISTLDLTLQNGSSLTGAINADNSAGQVSLTLDATSTWTVTADSYLTRLTDASGIDGSSITNVVGNGHTVYYDATDAANSALGGATYSLVGGGTLQPAA